MTFGAHRLVHSEPFLDYLYEVWKLLSALHNVMLKKILYRCTSIFSALNYCSGIFFKSLSCLYKVCAQTFPPIFGLFEIFDRTFAKIVAPPSNENENYVVYLKEQSILKKDLKIALKSTHKVTQYLFELCPPCTGRPSVKYKKHQF